MKDRIIKLALTVIYLLSIIVIHEIIGFENITVIILALIYLNQPSI